MAIVVALLGCSVGEKITWKAKLKRKIFCSSTLTTLCYPSPFLKGWSNYNIKVLVRFGQIIVANAITQVGDKNSCICSLCGIFKMEDPAPDGVPAVANQSSTSISSQSQPDRPFWSIAHLQRVTLLIGFTADKPFTLEAAIHIHPRNIWPASADQYQINSRGKKRRERNKKGEKRSLLSVRLLLLRLICNQFPSLLWGRHAEGTRSGH